MRNYEFGMKENPAKTKSYAFALRIVKCSQWFSDGKTESTLCRQLLRSGPSIGANVEEASGGRSGKDFMSKMSNAQGNSRIPFAGGDFFMMPTISRTISSIPSSPTATSS